MLALLALTGCAHQRVALPSWVTQPEYGYPPARFVVAVGTAQDGDVEAARAAARRAVAEQVRSQMEAETHRQLRAWSSRAGEDTRAGAEHGFAADIRSRTSFSHAELIQVVRVHVDPNPGRVYALGVLDRAVAAQALGADLDAALHRADQRTASSRTATRRIAQVVRLVAAREALVEAGAVALELGAVRRDPDAALDVLRRAADLDREIVALKAGTAWRIQLRAADPTMAEHLTLVHDGLQNALTELGFAVADENAAVEAVGTVRTQATDLGRGFRCRAGIDLIATENGEVVAEVHRDFVDTTKPEPSAVDACRLALALLSDSAQVGLEYALRRLAEEK